MQCSRMKLALINLLVLMISLGQLALPGKLMTFDENMENIY